HYLRAVRDALRWLRAGCFEAMVHATVDAWGVVGLPRWMSQTGRRWKNWRRRYGTLPIRV
ncbi:MAG: hypothetical protein ACK4N4_09655, partial [Burkholderiales bacterium]